MLLDFLGKSNTNENSGAIVGPALLIGVGSMLWRAWAELLEAQGVERFSPGLDELDLTVESTIHKVVDGRFPLMINVAAYADVDGAESNEALAMTINATGVGSLTRRCSEVGEKLVHFSTDYVFDGTADRPCPVDHPRSPENAYGRTKAAGVEQLDAAGCDYLLIRTSWLYASWGNNFVRTIARLAAERPTLRVVDDQRGRRTSAVHLASVSSQLIERQACGTYHVTDGGECTWYEFAQEIVAGLAADCEIDPCTSDEFTRPAPRPAYSVLDLSMTEALIGRLSSWEDNLKQVLSRLPLGSSSLG